MTKKGSPKTAFSRGDGRSRTAVQTTPQRAFYTLIPPLVVDLGLPKDGPAGAYPLNLGGA